MRTFYCIFGFVVFGLVLYIAFRDALGDRDWNWLATIGLLVADIFVPIPATVLITKMGIKHGPILGGLIGTLGVFSAGVTAYALTRMLGPRFARWLLKDEHDRAHRFFEESGSFAVACSRWLPLLPEAISFVAGLTRMHFGKYCLALLCGAVPMCFAYAALAGVSSNKIVPLVISITMPVPIWWFAARLLHRRATTRAPFAD